jgi:hypothetical protein
MKLPDIDKLPLKMFIVLCLFLGVGVIMGILFAFRFVQSLVPRFGILVPLGLFAIAVVFLKVTKK